MDIGRCHLPHQLRILPKGSGDAPPTGIRGQIGLRRKGGSKAQSQILPFDGLGKTTHYQRVEGCRKSQRGGPLGANAAGAGVELVGGLDFVARVRAVECRNAPRQAFAQGLNLVVPAGDGLRAIGMCKEDLPCVKVHNDIAQLVANIGRFCATLGIGFPVVGDPAHAHG